MATSPFLGEIRTFSFSFAPRGWATCNGQLLPINQNQALFSLLGTTYGGNGQTTFALPNLQGRTPLGPSTAYPLGQAGGVETVTLNSAQLPSHSHVANGSTGNSASAPGSSVLPGTLTGSQPMGYTASAAQLVAMSPAMVANAGGAQPHENRQPFLTVTLCIALQGIFPSRN